MSRTNNSATQTQGQGHTQGHVINPSICLRSISPKPFDTLYFIQMFLLVRRCAEPMTQLQRLKVKVTFQGHRLYP